MSEWIKWNGGERPVSEDTLVDIEWRCGSCETRTRAGTWSWAAGEGPHIIVAYRVVEETAQPSIVEAAAVLGAQEVPEDGRMVWDGAQMHGGPAADTITATLAERGKRYGVFSKHAEVTQAIKHALFTCRARSSLAPDQVEALEMIAHKLGRIVNGDPDYADSWVDIAGYAKLVADRLQGTSR